MDQRPILVIGASGYIGSRLVLNLLQRRFLVRAVSHDLPSLRKRPWSGHPSVQLVEADVQNYESLKKACAGGVAAFYLAQSVREGYWSFPKKNRQAAQNMAKAAEETQLARLIYLGSLGDASKSKSRLLKSRYEVGEILKSGKTPVTIFKCGLILGSGNPSFEILRYMADRLPVQPGFSWLQKECQPISARDVIECLAKSLEVPETAGQEFDLAGKEVLQYQRLLKIYAEEAGLWRKLTVPAKFLGPWVSAKLLRRITPIDPEWLYAVLDSFSEKSMSGETKIQSLIPLQYPWVRDTVKMMIYQNNEIIERSLPPDSLPVEWSLKGDPEWSGGGLMKFSGTSIVAATPEDAWRVLSRIGGKVGWYYGNFVWALRGLLDRMLGGTGMAAGRKDDFNLKVNDPADGWVIKIAEPQKRLLLKSTLKMPGQCYYDFQIRPVDSEKIELKQEIIFIPKGLAGVLYWKIFRPVHSRVFNGMVDATASRVSLKII